mgnify:CR=1 FL=1
MKFKIFVLILSSFCLIFSSCSSVKMPKCVGKQDKDLIIRWGEIYQKQKMTTYYELNTSLDLLLVIQRDDNSEPKIQKIGKFNDSLYCNLLTKLRNGIIEVQSLNSPGDDVSNFMEYVDKTNNAHFRATWNPIFTNKGNELFKKIFSEYQEGIKNSQ